MTPARGDRPRFLILTQYYPPEVGAAQIRLRALARHLLGRGFAVTVVTAMPNYPAGRILPGYGGLLRREELDGVPVIRTWIWPATGRGALRRVLSYASFCASSLIGAFLAPRPDWIIVESPPLFLGLTAYFVSRLRRAPYVLVVSDLWPASVVALGVVTNRSLIGLAERLERFLYRKAFLVAALTEGIRAAAGVAGRAVLVPNGVDTDVFRRVAEPVEWVRPGEVAFVFAGTHGYAQGLDVILAAAEHLRERAEIVFLLVGEGPEKERLQRVAEERGLAGVRFVPGQPAAAMPALFSACRASIVTLLDNPLFRGARPSKILPSLACETPVIFSGEGESADLIADNDCGLVVPPGDGEALAAAVRKLTADPGLASRLGANGRRLAEREFSWGPILDRRLLAEILPE